MIPSARLGARRWRNPLLRLVVAGALTALCLWQVADHAAHLHPEAILAALAAVPVAHWAAAVAVAALSFLAVAGQERAAVAHFGFRLDPVAGRRAAMAAAAVSQTVGFGPVVGAVIRKRLLPELTMAQSALVSLAITIGFFSGLGLVALAFAAGRLGGVWGLCMVISGVVAIPFALGRLPARMRAHLPGFPIVLRFAFWLAVDLLALAVACWIVMPSGALGGIGFAGFLPVFLLALGAGLASGSPAGTGPFEAMMLEGLAMDPNLTIAGIVAFRMVAYALPALCGAVWAFVGPMHAATRGQVGGLAPIAPSAGWLRRLPRAEVQLSLQGEVGLTRTLSGDLWLSALRGGVRVVLGDPVRASDGRIDTRLALRDARHEAAVSGAALCLYRIGPRLAATARQSGMSVLPIAQEAVLDPVAFTLSGAARAGLRRKLRHAEAAGVRIDAGPAPALCELAAVAADWSRRHGGERGFSMGRFDAASLGHQRVFAARAADRSVVAFLSFHVAEGEWVLDLIRSRDAMPDGTLYLLLCHALAEAAAAGVRRFSLANVPVAGFGMLGPAGRVLRRVTARSEGLRQFKAAFRPRWEPRYIAAPNRISLLVGALVVAQSVHRPIPRAASTGMISISSLPFV